MIDIYGTKEDLEEVEKVLKGRGGEVVPYIPDGRRHLTIYDGGKNRYGFHGGDPEYNPISAADWLKENRAELDAKTFAVCDDPGIEAFSDAEPLTDKLLYSTLDKFKEVEPFTPVTPTAPTYSRLPLTMGVASSELHNNKPFFNWRSMMKLLTGRIAVGLICSAVVYGAATFNANIGLHTEETVTASELDEIGKVSSLTLGEVKYIREPARMTEQGLLITGPGVWQSLPDFETPASKTQKQLDQLAARIEAKHAYIKANPSEAFDKPLTVKKFNPHLKTGK